MRMNFWWCCARMLQNQHKYVVSDVYLFSYLCLFTSNFTENSSGNNTNSFAKITDENRIFELKNN